MNKKVLIVFAIALALSLTVYASVFSAPSGGTTTSTTFVLQNLGSATANAAVDFRKTDGTIQYTASGITIPVGASVNFDQRYDTNLGTSFQGGAIASSDQPLGAVVNVLRVAIAGSGASNAYESYNGFDSTATGQSIRLPQILKNVSSGGLVYNTQISIQNTDVSSAAAVTLTFTPDPVLNPAVCVSPSVCISSPFVKTGISVPAGGVYVLDQSSQPNTEIGDKFFGAVLVTSGNNVAVQVLSTGSSGGADQVLLAYPSYAGGTTGQISLPSVYKNLVSLGDSYSTAFLIANFGSVAANVTITYTAGAVGSVSGVDTITVGPNSVKNVDQRYDAPSITSASFLGSATAASTNGQPIAIMVNLRGGARYAMTYDGIRGGGAKVYLPVGYKYINSAGYSWSSTAVVHNFGSAPANIHISYFDTRAGKPSVTNLGPYVVTDTVQIDLRYHVSTSTLTDFFGSIVIDSDQPVGAMVQTRGSGGSGDALFAYKGLTP